MELNEYQHRANLSDQRPGRDDQALVFPLMGMASEVGSLVNQYKKRIRDGDAHELFSERVATELGDLLWYVSNLSAKLNLDLEAVAQLNLRRIGERWPVGAIDSTPSRLLDDDYPTSEQFPREFSVRFTETMEDGRLRVRITRDGTQLGDPLSDMAWEGDEYRFHDAFHFTYAALLGWSPIVRAFLGAQRGSAPVLREVEDSGRAKIIEEAVAAIVFEYARHQRFLAGVDHVDFALLETVRGMTSRLEVRLRSVREWERAVLTSFAVWRELRDHRGGILHLDLKAQSIRFDQA